MTVSQNSDDEKTKRQPYHFGEKLRQVREHKGYTLKMVAQRAGVSESLVSQIERNHVSPAIDTLLALADVLDINLEFLFEEYKKGRPVQIIRSDERATIMEDDITIQELATAANSDKDNSLESYMISVPVASHTHRGSYGHIGREIGIIISGTPSKNIIYDEYSNGDFIYNQSCYIFCFCHKWSNAYDNRNHHKDIISTA